MNQIPVGLACFIVHHLFEDLGNEGMKRSEVDFELGGKISSDEFVVKIEELVPIFEKKIIKIRLNKLVDIIENI